MICCENTVNFKYNPSYLPNLGPLTLFAPTDEAFSLATPPTDPKRLRDFVLQHIVSGRITPQDVRNDVTVPSLHANRPLRFNMYEDGQVRHLQHNPYK